MSLNSPSPPRRSLSPTAVAVLVVLVAAAAIGGNAAYYELRPVPESGGSGSTVTLTDDLGRTVTVPVNASRVVVLAPSIMDSMSRLGLRANVVGVDCDAAADPASHGLAADYNASQIAAWSLTPALCVGVLPAVNTEDLLNLSPALVLASTLSPVGSLEEASRTYGIPLFFLAPTTVGGIVVDVTWLGEIFDRPQAAATLADALQAVLGLAQNVSQNLTNSFTPLPTVLLTYYAAPAGSSYAGYFTYGPTTFGQSLVELASGVSIASNTTTPYPELSGDEVLIANPQYIIYGTGFGIDLTTYQAAPEWAQFPAVSQGSAHGIDSNYLTEADPSMVLIGLPWLLHALHPALVPG